MEGHDRALWRAAPTRPRQRRKPALLGRDPMPQGQASSQPLSRGGCRKSPAPGIRFPRSPVGRVRRVFITLKRNCTSESAVTRQENWHTATLKDAPNPTYLTDDHLDRQLGIQVLPDSRKGQRHIGSPGSRQDVGDPRGRQHVGGSGPAGTAVFQTAYGPHDQLSATVRADALRATPDNAGQPAGLIPAVYANGDTGLMRSAARSFRVPTQRCGNEKKPLSRRERGWGEGVKGKDRCLLRHPPAGKAALKLNLSALVATQVVASTPHLRRRFESGDNIHLQQ